MTTFQVCLLILLGWIAFPLMLCGLFCGWYLVEYVRDRLRDKRLVRAHDEAMKFWGARG